MNCKAHNTLKFMVHACYTVVEVNKMKRHIIYTIITGVIIPSLVICLVLRLKNRGQDNRQTDPLLNTATDQQNPEENYVDVLTEQGVVTMGLEDYITCVVLGEMPLDFESEALKAQAVVARTYTCNKKQNSKHETCDVCTDSACCQAFYAQEEYLTSGGSKAFYDRVREAVLQTKGQVLTYQGEIIEATYFSCSGGKTEDAQAVWGSDIPYLQSVESPGEEMATHYTDTVHFSASEFRKHLGLSDGQIRIEDIRYTKGGGVAQLSVNGKIFSGTQLRKLLNLRSTAFVITVMGESVTVTTKGFGHRVGMSQYGAEAMALQGKTYQDILSHYYVGTELVSPDFG